MRWGVFVAGAILLGALPPAEAEAAFLRRPDPEVEAGRRALREQDAEAALRHFDEALARHPDAAALHLNRGLALRALGRAEEAESALTQALALGGSAREAHHALGHLLAEAGEVERAMSHFRHALALDPDDEVARRNLEALLRRQRQAPDPDDAQGNEGEDAPEDAGGEEGEDDREGAEGGDGDEEQEGAEGEEGEDEQESAEGGDDAHEEGDAEGQEGEDEQESAEGGDDADEQGEAEGEEGADEQEGAQGDDGEERGEAPGAAGEPQASDEDPDAGAAHPMEHEEGPTDTERLLDALQQRERGLQLWLHGQQKRKARDGERDW